MILDPIGHQLGLILGRIVHVINDLTWLEDEPPQLYGMDKVFSERQA